MKILIGLVEIGGLIPVYVEALRALGHQVSTVVIQKSHWFPYKYDIDFSEMANRSADPFIYGYSAATHDLVIFLWARSSFLPGQMDLPLLRSMGKKIVTVCCGSDVRDVEGYKQWFEEARTYLNEIPFNPENLEASLRPLRMAERFSNVILSQPNQSIMGIRPFHHFFVPIQLSKIRFCVPDREIPVICHIPARNKVKGTQYFLNALETLRNEGVKFDFHLKENIPNEKVLEDYSDADIVLDELFFPLHGKTTLEAMAAGCAVANGDREELEPFPQKRPIWRVEPERLVEQLRELISNRAARTQMAHDARRHVERYHDHIQVARDLIRVVEGDFNAIPLSYPKFFLTKYQIPTDERVPADLQHISAEIINLWGAPDGADLSLAASRGLIAAHTSSAPRWGKQPRDNERIAEQMT